MRANPYEFYDEAREGARAQEVPGHPGLPVPHYLTTHYDDTIAIARDYAQFSSLRPVLNSGDAELDAIRAEGWPAAPGLVTNDPPAHTRYRKLVNGAFTTGAVKRAESAMLGIIDTLIDGFVERGSVELMSEFAMPLPVRYTGLMLGVPEDEQAQFAFAGVLPVPKRCVLPIGHSEEHMSEPRQRVLPWARQKYLVRRW